MKILVYGTKKYDRDAFEEASQKYLNLELQFLEADLDENTVPLAKGFDAICGFVSSDLSKTVIDKLADYEIHLILMRCAGFNNIDLSEAKKKDMTILRVPGYSPEAVAEHAMGLALCVNRKIHKGYIKVRENNFSLIGLTGTNFYNKTAGIIGTGKIGAAMCRICKGFGMRVIAYDLYPNKSLEFVEYVSLETLWKESDLISLHCPLTKENYHLICSRTIEQMKNNVILVNTSRGALIDSEQLIKGIRSKKFAGVALDVYEEETDYVFENKEEDILETSIVARFLSFPNVIMTSHQGFLTNEALRAISETTLQNAKDFEDGNIKENNIVKA